jgi:hypothetical protein
MLMYEIPLWRCNKSVGMLLVCLCYDHDGKESLARLRFLLFPFLMLYLTCWEEKRERMKLISPSVYPN